MSPLPSLAIGPTVEYMERHTVRIRTLFNVHVLVHMTRATRLYFTAIYILDIESELRSRRAEDCQKATLNDYRSASAYGFIYDPAPQVHESTMSIRVALLPREQLTSYRGPAVTHKVAHRYRRRFFNRLGGHSLLMTL